MIVLDNIVIIINFNYNRLPLRNLSILLSLVFSQVNLLLVVLIIERNWDFQIFATKCEKT